MTYIVCREVFSYISICEPPFWRGFRFLAFLYKLRQWALTVTLRHLNLTAYYFKQLILHYSLSREYGNISRQENLSEKMRVTLVRWSTHCFAKTYVDDYSIRYLVPESSTRRALSTLADRQSPGNLKRRTVRTTESVVAKKQLFSDQVARKNAQRLVFWEPL